MDCNPGLEFSIPGFGIVEFPIPGSRRDWRSIVKTTKIAKWVTIWVAIFELGLQVCTIVLRIADVNIVNRTVIYYYNYYSVSADMLSTV